MSNETPNLPSTNLLPNMNDFQMFQVIAKNAQTSGLYKGVGEEAKIFMILLAARELGVGPMQALNGGIWNILGKIEISARLMSAMIRRAGHSISFKQNDDKACVLIGKRADNGDTAEVSFTIEDARTAGLAGRDVWKKYTEDMLYARCLSRLGRRLFADVIGTAYVEGEIRDELIKEKNLPQAECEDVTQKPFELIEEKPQAEEPPKEEPIPIKYINPAQMKMFNDKYEQVDEKTRSIIDERIQTLNIPDLKQMPEDEWMKFMKSFEKYFSKKEKK